MEEEKTIEKFVQQSRREFIISSAAALFAGGWSWSSWERIGEDPNDSIVRSLGLFIVPIVGAACLMNAGSKGVEVVRDILSYVDSNSESTQEEIS